MPTVQNPQYPVQNPGQSSVSPFARGGSAPAAPGAQGMPQSPFPVDSVQTQPMARGIQPNVNLLKDAPSSVSPFNRKPGETIDFLNQTPPSQPAGPAAAAGPQEPGPIVFTFPKDIPDGPAIANIQEAVLQEVQPVQQPGQAIQLIAGHSNQAKEAREAANRITWGARYYAVQAAELAEQALKQWPQMDTTQRQTTMAKIAEFRDLAVANLNDAKKQSITTYNAALKANLIYNHFFTGTGSMVGALDTQTREAVKTELDDAWSRWNGSFAKQWQGQMVQAQGILPLIEGVSQEVSGHLHRMNTVLSQLN